MRGKSRTVVVGAMETIIEFRRNSDFGDLSRRMKSAFLITFVAIDKSNPRAGSAADKAEIKNERENSIICVVQETTFPGASGDPRTKLRFVFMRYKTLGCSLPFNLIISSI